MDAIDKTLAGQGAILSADCVPLDEYVRSAWSAANPDIDAESEAEAGPDDRFIATESEAESGLPAFPAVMPGNVTPSSPIQMRLQLRRDAISPTAQPVTEQIESPRTFQPKEKSLDNASGIGFVPPAILPPQPNLSWLPQRGVAAPIASNTLPLSKMYTAVAASPVRAERVERIERPANPATPPAIVSATKQKTTSATQPAETPKTIPALAEVSSSKQKPTLPSQQGERFNSVDSVDNTERSAKPSASAPHAIAQSSSLQTGAPEAMAVNPSPTLSAAAATTATTAKATATAPLKQKHPSPSAELPLQSPQGVIPQTAIESPLLQGGNAEQPRQVKPQKPQAHTAPAAAVKTDGAANSSGPSLTYRFDKWNGNHAVTVQTAAPADMPSTTSTANAAESAPGFASAAQSPSQNAAQYTLAPSDQLVGQRLGEHLTQLRHSTDLPSMYLKDADEQQQRQRQETPQEDEEGEQ
jgi:hypothetical protein